MFTVALFTIAKIGEQPKCPSVEGWKKKYVYTCTHTHTHTLEYYSAMKGMKSCNNMDGPKGCYAN